MFKWLTAGIISQAQDTLFKRNSFGRSTFGLVVSAEVVKFL
jgi:hypothetical protein